MRVRDVMSTPPVTCQPGTDLAAVTKLMWDRDCGFVPVVDAAGHLAGVLTDRDICVAAATRRLQPERIPASDVMHAPVHSCLSTDALDAVLATMSTHQLRRLPVLDASGQLQGVVSMNDVARVAGTRGAPSASAIVSAMAAICARRPLVSAGA